MKRLLLIGIALLTLALIFFGIIRKEPASYSGVLFARMPVKSAYRFMADTSYWPKWWPGENRNGSYVLNNYRVSYRPLPLTEAGLRIFDEKNDSVAAIVSFSRSGADSVALSYTLSGYRQQSLLANWVKGNAARRTLQQLLQAFAEKAAAATYMYGMEVYHEKVKDTLMVATKQVFEHLPGVAEYYGLIEKLERVLSEQQISPSGAPMLHVAKNSYGVFEAQVAIPVLREPRVSGDIYIKRMVLGKILRAPITGGPATVARQEIQFDNYLADMGLTSPAIAYQSLVTDRRKEADTTKWKTELYYPVL
jgi:hypothetical protein